MTLTVVAVGRDAPFKEIVRIMEQWKVGALPVLEGEGCVIGVVSEADPLAREALRDSASGSSDQPGRQLGLVKARAVTAEGQAITTPLTTALARIEPGAASWTLRWSTAGHLPPLLITPDGQAAYLHAEPDVPRGVDTDPPRPDHDHPLSAGATVIFFTDGLVEHPHRPIDTGLRALSAAVAAPVTNG
ncbi:SpoIIE family protein phosphatase [Streptomyces flaveolus]|uniref:SpoIIE family protein phosphatase n=1 Tax=Streptomyces flaveolus TaxID=67297 RepID=UPI0033AE70A3